MNSELERHRRQFVSFSSYRVLPEWRRLSLGEREDQRHEFAETVRKWEMPDTMKVLSYSLVGVRPDADMLLWRICYSISCLQEMASDLLRTRLGGYLETTYSYLGMTRRSEYMIGEAEGYQELHGSLRPGGAKYLFLYPMVRTRAWYMLPFQDRQRMVLEVVEVAHEFTGMQWHVIYSFGLDDQDFMIATETDEPDMYLERVLRLRETESSSFIQRDTPMFTCVRATVDSMLERLG